MTRNQRTAGLFAGIAVAMLALAFASVPLYRAFCQVTGLNGTVQRGADAPGATGQKVAVAFDTNISPKLRWRFEPEQRREHIDVGARDMVFFTAQNLTDRPLTGTATFNVTPARVGKYFRKIECFCFTQQTLAAREKVRMPVIFYVDPQLYNDPDTNDVREITLSYTFYPVDSQGGTS
ncbi:cytochrome c oxidase assembly protein [Stakelama sediminis]|uniref:Cytochrome c oxidase assembly protein CtaG n=1 Tax=Stakelama sediminis TaxID=463200 RepID=A0A840YW37_9SPHN|nr:cytochrome c oxidase assembly protein subunit 11 [Stakelama sediminis]